MGRRLKVQPKAVVILTAVVLFAGHLAAHSSCLPHFMSPQMVISCGLFFPAIKRKIFKITGCGFGGPVIFHLHIVKGYLLVDMTRFFSCRQLLVFNTGWFGCFCYSSVIGYYFIAKKKCGTRLICWARTLWRSSVSEFLLNWIKFS